MKTEQVEVEPRDTMFRPEGREAHRPYEIQPWLAKHIEQSRLFTPRTRRYLRRRAWRYFRVLGKKSPDRYVPAIGVALRRYADDDVRDELALVDNWGLMHALFHHSPVLAFPAKRCELVAGKSWAELAPAPAFPSCGTSDPRRSLTSCSRPVVAPCGSGRGGCWPSIGPISRRCRSRSCSRCWRIPIPTWWPSAWSSSAATSGLDSVPIENWLRLLESDDPQVLETICNLMAARLNRERLTLADAVLLARNRVLPVARLGLNLLGAKQVQSEANAELR